MDFLEPSNYRGHTELLGDATYWNVKAASRIEENAAWSYPEPVSDELDLSNFYVDGEEQTRPETVWSKWGT
jgi:uncharacterized protein (DUF427 family)